MIIGIDGNEANIKNRVGVNKYAFELIWGIYKLLPKWPKNHRLIVYLKNQPLEDMPKEDNFLEYRVISGGGMWIIKKLMPRLFLDKKDLDVFFSPSHYVPPFCPVPRVCAIMDLGYLKFSAQFKKYDFWQLKLWTAWSIFVSKYIIAISETTKEDIVRHYSFASKKAFVTLLSYDENIFNNKISVTNVRRIKNKYSIVNDYILFLSTLKPSKNIEGIVDAWAEIANAFPKVSLVIAGKKGWLYESIFEKVEKLGLEKRVVFTDFVDEKDKPALVKGAKLFILPSFWEGFGIDTLSSMAAGVPVVVSDRGSLPEVVGDAGIIVNPENPQEIALALKKVLTMNKLEYNKLVNKGFERIKHFSWEKTATKTLEILEKLEH